MTATSRLGSSAASRSARRARARARCRRGSPRPGGAGRGRPARRRRRRSPRRWSRSGATAWASRAASCTSDTRSTGARSSGRPWSRRARWSRSSTSDAHPNGLLLRAAHGIVELRRLLERPGAVELGVPADGRDGGPELVRRIGDEPPEAGLGLGALVEGVLDATEHPVEGHAEVAGLGVRARPRARAATGRPPRWRRRSRSSAAPAGPRGGSPTTSRAPSTPSTASTAAASTATRRRTASSTSSSGSAMTVRPAVPQLDALPHPVVDVRIVARDGDDLPDLERIDRAVVEARAWGPRRWSAVGRARARRRSSGPRRSSGSGEGHPRRSGAPRTRRAGRRPAARRCSAGHRPGR